MNLFFLLLFFFKKKFASVEMVCMRHKHLHGLGLLHNLAGFVGKIYFQLKKKLD